MIPRIGRTPTPSEVGLRVLLENADVLDDSASVLYEDSLRWRRPKQGRRQFVPWSELPSDERDVWRLRAVAIQRQHAAPESLS